MIIDFLISRPDGVSEIDLRNAIMPVAVSNKDNEDKWVPSFLHYIAAMRELSRSNVLEASDPHILRIDPLKMLHVVAMRG